MERRCGSASSRPKQGTSFTLRLQSFASLTLVFLGVGFSHFYQIVESCKRKHVLYCGDLDYNIKYLWSDSSRLIPNLRPTKILDQRSHGAVIITCEILILGQRYSGFLARSTGSKMSRFGSFENNYTLSTDIYIYVFMYTNKLWLLENAQ